MVSVCTPPSSHPRIVSDCVDAGVGAIHCEKPLATTWKECRETVRTCEEAGTTLTVNHQRRYARPFRRAKGLLDGGAIGDLERVEFTAPNLFDYGVHMFDLCNYVADGAPVEWVRADLAYERENRWYGVHHENRALAHWRYASGIDGVAATGNPPPANARFRVVGTERTVEVGPGDGHVCRVGSPGDWHRVRTWGDTAEKLDPYSVRGRAMRVARNLPWTALRRLAPASYTERAVAAVVRAIREGRRPELHAEGSLRATELAFACWESAARNERVELPLSIDGNPLEGMLESGRLDPTSAE